MVKKLHESGGGSTLHQTRGLTFLPGFDVSIKPGAEQTMRWKPALNAFAITFSDRFPAAETY